MGFPPVTGSSRADWLFAAGATPAPKRLAARRVSSDIGPHVPENGRTGDFTVQGVILLRDSWLAELLE